MFNKVLLSAVVLIGFAVQAFAQLPTMPPPSTKEVDKSEILRWGDRVVESGTGIQAPVDQQLFTAAMAPPEDDSDCWFITVFGMKNCPQCSKLLKDFEQTDLAAFVAPPPGKTKPWAHFNYYQHGDPFQKEKFKQYKVENGPFPILIIQPPRNGKYGKPEWVVWRFEARELGSPAALKKAIPKVVEHYCKKLADSGYQPPVNAQTSKKTSASDGIPAANPYAIGQTVPNQPITSTAKKNESVPETWGGPWGPDPPAPPNFNPQYPNNFNPTGPTPNAFPDSGGGFGMVDLAQWALILLALLKVYENIAPAMGWPTGFAIALKKFLEGLTPQQQAAVMNAAAPQSSTVPPPGYLLNSAGQLVPDVAAPSPRSRTK